MSEHTEKTKRNWSSLSFYEILSTIFSALSLVISVAGIIFVVVTLQSNNSAFYTNTYLQTFGETYEIDKIFLQYPNLVPYFYHGVPVEPPDTNYKRASITAELILDHLDAILNNENYFKIHPTVEKSWVDYTSEQFKKSPVLKKIYDDNPQNWPVIQAEVCSKSCVKR